MSKSIIVLLFSFFLGIFLLVLVLRFVGLASIRETFSAFSGPRGLVILFLSLLVILAGAWRWRYILNSLGHKVPFWEIFRIYISYFSVSFLAPQFGIGIETVRPYILREKYNIAWSKALSSIVVERILELTINTLIIFGGAGIILLIVGLPPIGVVLFFGGILAAVSSLISFFYFRSFRKESIVKIFLKKQVKKGNLVEVEKEIFSFFDPHNIFMWQALAISLIKASLQFIRLWTLILFLGKIVNPLLVVPVLSSFYIAMWIPVPAVLGIHDGLQAFSFEAIGLGKSMGAVFAFILRGADLLLALLGIVILLRLGIDLFRTVLVKKAEKLATLYK